MYHLPMHRNRPSQEIPIQKTSDSKSFRSDYGIITEEPTHTSGYDQESSRLANLYL